MIQLGSDPDCIIFLLGECLVAENDMEPGRSKPRAISMRL